MCPLSPPPGDCSDLARQFAALPVLPSFPLGMADWTCTAFPDPDANPLDYLIMGASAL